MPKPIQEWARATIQRITPYVPGKPIPEVQRELGLSEVIKLGSNENSLGPSPKAMAAVAAAAREMHLYPDNANFLLKRALADRLGMPPETVVLGAGSTALVRLIAETFMHPEDQVIFPHPTFPMYAIDTRLMGAEEVVVLDEAYFEYAQDLPGYPDGLDYVRRGHRLIVLRTLSKIYGLAGIRVGYAVTQPEIAQCLRRVRDPFSVNSLAQAAALAALDDHEHVARGIELADRGRQQIYRACDEMGLPYVQSGANFVWLDTGRDTTAVGNELLKRGIIVRPGNVFNTISWLRVTVGTEAENARFITALQEILQA